MTFAYGDLSVLGGISVFDGNVSWQDAEDMTEIINDHFDHEDLSPDQAAWMLNEYMSSFFLKKEISELDDKFWEEYEYDIGTELANQMKEAIVEQNVQRLYIFSLSDTDLNIAMVG